ncbi:HlyD family secretion protein [Ancylobacter pratisalsi]|uniref:HlyD family secretion protein n=1 Tax=Ancylobacter pratisalsi TaxID=1745854 RepID=A0A6P1YS41_9HYPH|nr:HlyD family secretion protein [Ancylobacter pratisalsi]QIB34524.1 HlyD family secretion protein [Ancylobacter pratisalsi]
MASVTIMETAKRIQQPEDVPPSVAGVDSTASRLGGLRSILRVVLTVVLLAGVLGGGLYAGWAYWTQWRFEVSTDDAYVQADIVTIAPQVAGNIAKLMVNDNQIVKAGQVLAIIEQKDFQAAVDQAKAGTQQSQAAIATIEAELAQQQAAISEAQATIDADKAAEVFAEQNNQRFGTLAKDGYGSIQNAQQATAQVASSKAVVTKDVAALESARKQIGTLTAELAQAKATLAQNEAVLKQAEINLGYTTITAPVDGVVGNRSLRLGQYVQPGTQLLAIVPLARTYVIANFKETQLDHVRAGQPVEFSVDTFDGEIVHGFVNSIAPASGEEFALLPPDNATGNFTKIVQRIPVKISIDPSDPLAGKLRPGMSVTATINVRDTAGAPLTQRPAS